MKLFGNAPTSFPHQIQYQNSYRRKYREKSILPLITNSGWKGHFYKKGMEIRVPIQPTVIIRDTHPGEGIIYQKPKAPEEVFTIGRESYWALEFMPEETEFIPWDVKAPIVNDASEQLAEHIEMKFGKDIILKIDERNKGHHAGARSGGFDLGGPEDGGAIKLFKTQKQADDDSSHDHKEVAPDFIVHCFNSLKEQKGGKGQDFWMVVPTVVADRVQTSELKMAGWMNEANSLLRKDVSAIGGLGGGTIIQDDQMLPIFKDSAGKNVYPILFGSKVATTYADEVVFRGNNLTDKDSWDEYHRCKTIYDWFLRFPEFLGVAYVQV